MCIYILQLCKDEIMFTLIYMYLELLLDFLRSCLVKAALNEYSVTSSRSHRASV